LRSKDVTLTNLILGVSFKKHRFFRWTQSGIDSAQD